MTHWEFSHIPFDGDLTDDEIVCQKCGWHWKVKDGGDDLYVCHKCYSDNSRFYLKKEQFSKFVDVNALVQAGTQIVGATAGAIGSSKQAKATKEASKTETDKEIFTRCGKDKSKAWSKKKKSEYLSCKNSVIQKIDTDKQASKEEKIKAQDLLIKQSTEREKSKRTQTYIVVGIIAVIIGVVIYKKMNK
jgi:hypothetical protein